ncbi:MAG TPA: CBS domain-containing protein [Gaiellaceae bacterium]|jgi:CBS domain-containing protein
MAVADVMAFRVVKVSPEDPVRVAIARMLEENVGSVAVCDGERLAGIFTERDVLRLTSEGPDFDEVRVGDVMTTQLVTLSPDDDILDAARLMGERKIRHLPVLEGENLLGMVGIREVVRVLLERLWRTHDPEARDRARELLDRPSAPVSSDA